MNGEIEIARLQEQTAELRRRQDDIEETVKANAKTSSDGLKAAYDELNGLKRFQSVVTALWGVLVAAVGYLVGAAEWFKPH